MRIVSLVPSLTEALFEYGLGSSLVGRTRWCTEPASGVSSVEVVGGTKNPDVARIIELEPDLVVVNREENRREDCDALRQAGLALHVTHPRSVAQAATMLEQLGAACGASRAGADLARRCREALARAETAMAARPSRPLTFCPIWRRPWMTFRRDTYIGDMLALSGCDNAFGEREGPDFFEVAIEEVLAAGPAVVVLPDEPFLFEERHADELRAAGLGAARFVFVDGKDLAWYGPRIPAALERLHNRIFEGGSAAPVVSAGRSSGA